MQEFWINNQEDLKEFRSYLFEENIEPVPIEWTDGQTTYKVGDIKVHVPDEFSIKDDTNQKYDKLIFGKDQTEKITNITIEEGIAYIYRANQKNPTQIPYNKWAIGVNYAEGCEKLKGYQYYKYIRNINEQEYSELKKYWNPKVWMPRSPEEGFMLRNGYTYYKGMKVEDVSLLSFDIEATGINKDAEDAYIPLVSMTYRSRDGEITKTLFDIFDYETDQKMWNDINCFVKKHDPDIILGHNIFSYDLPYADKNSSTGLLWGRDDNRIKFNTDKKSKYRKNQQQQYEYYDAQIHGRDIIDTFFLSMKWDIGNDLPSYGLKALEDHFELVKENRTWDFKKWPVRKLIEEKKKKTEIGQKMWKEFRKYCIDDADTPIKLFDSMVPAFFYLTQSVPKTLQQVINQASGSQLDSLMIRSYLQDGYSLPRTSQKVPFEGAISMGKPGLYKYVRKVDVASLYPSIMLQYNIYDTKKDPQKHLLKILDYFRQERLINKKKGQDGSIYHAQLDAAQKIVINSMYGFLGANFLLFNFPDGAAEVTKRGREILLKGVEWATGHTLEKVVKNIKNEGKDNEEIKYEWIVGQKVSKGLGYSLVNVDTDSFSVSNGQLPTKEEFKEEIKKLNSIYPKLIKWEDDGVFEKLLVIKAKNYVLQKHKNWCKPKELDENGDPKIKYKGSSITDQKKEPILIDFIHDFINLILNQESLNSPDLIRLYNQYCQKALNIQDITKWLTKKTVTTSVLNPERPNEQKLLDAINEAIEKKVIDSIQEGDKVWLYTAIDGEKQKLVKGQPKYQKYKKKEYEELGIEKKQALETCDHKENLTCMSCNPDLYYPKMIPNTINRFPELWNSKDHDTWHYVERVFKTVEIFKKIVDIDKFPNYSNKKNRQLLEKI